MQTNRGKPSCFKFYFIFYWKGGLFENNKYMNTLKHILEYNLKYALMLNFYVASLSYRSKYNLFSKLKISGRMHH